MGEVVHRIDAPLVAGPVMLGEADPVEGRIAQVHVRRGHVDARPQHMAAFRVATVAHLAQQRQALGRGAVAPGRVAPGFGERAATGPHLLGILRIDIGMAAAHQVLGHGEQVSEVVAGVVQVRLMAGGGFMRPAEAQPAHRIEDRVDVLLVFLDRVGVVEAHVAMAAEVARQPEVQADRLGVADVQIAVGLGREPGADARRIERTRQVAGCGVGPTRPAALRVHALRQIGLDLAADEIADGRGNLLGHRVRRRAARPRRAGWRWGESRRPRRARRSPFRAESATGGYRPLSCRRRLRPSRG